MELGYAGDFIGTMKIMNVQKACPQFVQSLHLQT